MTTSKAFRFWRILRQSSLIFIITIVLTFIVFEIYFSINPAKNWIEKTFPTQLTRYPYPYQMFKGKPNVKDHNSLGYRAPEISASASNKTKIFIFGGSTVYNGLTPISERLQGYLREKLNTDNIDVYNFGVVSSVSGQELARLIFEAIDYKPDLVIMYNGGNDYLCAKNWEPRPGFPYNFVAYENNPLLINENPYKNLLISFHTTRMLLNYFPSLYIDMNAKKLEVAYRSEKWIEQIAFTYLNNSNKAYQFCMVRDVKFAVFFQPLKAYLSDDKLAASYRNSVLSQSQHDQFKQLPFYDISDTFKDENIFRDNIHIQEDAKSIIAESIGSIILNRVLIKKPAN